MPHVFKEITDHRQSARPSTSTRSSSSCSVSSSRLGAGKRTWEEEMTPRSLRISLRMPPPRLLRLAGPLCDHLRRDRRATHDDRHAPADGRDVPLRDHAPFGVRELVRLAHDPEDGDAVDAGTQVELRERLDALLVQISLVGERCQRYGADAVQGHGSSITTRGPMYSPSSRRFLFFPRLWLTNSRQCGNRPRFLGRSQHRVLESLGGVTVSPRTAVCCG
jgi:hypothetical protein